MNEFYSRIIESAARALTKEMLIAANIGNMIDEGVVIADRNFFDEPLAARRLDKMVDDEWKNHVGVVKAVLLSFIREAGVAEPAITEVLRAVYHLGLRAVYHLGEREWSKKDQPDWEQATWADLLKVLKDGLSA